MIFVTVGSQKFPFDRLIKKVDQMLREGLIQEEVFIQTGTSGYAPACPHQTFCERARFEELLETCDILITHGSAGTMVDAAKRRNPDFDRKCTALLVIDSICEDAAVRSREVLPDFQQLALEIYRDLAREAVERNLKAGQTFRYLKRFQKGVRRHFSRRALVLLPRARGRAAVLALYASTAAFWVLARVYARIKRQGGE